MFLYESVIFPDAGREHFEVKVYGLECSLGDAECSQPLRDAREKACV